PLYASALIPKPSPVTVGGFAWATPRYSHSPNGNGMHGAEYLGPTGPP
ncbi:hypothetical protein HDE78_004217, partial [Rhodanobacter sp. K2T2]|nr:hypothetical protein [Rhodanobacter sp. K2T2]